MESFGEARPLTGVRIVALVMNVPGPIAAARLRELGADVVKIEPAQGDPLESAAPQWYARLCADLRVIRLDLKCDSDRAHLERELANVDLLLTATRTSALARLGLDWTRLHKRFERLCHVAILGESAPHDDRAGHDLTYQAKAGLLAPPAMPRTLFADLFAAERAVNAALLALFLRERSGVATRTEVAIADGAATLVDPIRYGLTNAGGPLSGASPLYRIYRAADGWIALAALEPHFQARLREALGSEKLDADTLEQCFAQRTCAYWSELAERFDLPIAALESI